MTSGTEGFASMDANLWVLLPAQSWPQFPLLELFQATNIVHLLS